MENITLGQLKTEVVKHNTPKEGSISFKSLLSFSNSLASLTPLPNKLIQDSSGGWSSEYQKSAYKMMTTYNERPSNSSQIMFPTRLSTVIDVEESTEAFQQTSPFPMMARKRSSNCSDTQSNEGLFATTEQTKSGQEATIFKESVTQRRKKRNMTKELVRKWELRQLKNIEEATTHELTIEYV